MSLTFRFLLDENVDIRLARQIRRKGWVAVFTPRGLKNGEVITLAKKEKLVLLTNDIDKLTRVLLDFLTKTKPHRLEGERFVLTDGDQGANLKAG